MILIVCTIILAITACYIANIQYKIAEFTRLSHIEDRLERLGRPGTLTKRTKWWKI